jgi:DNA mismatch endonuclease (patch repair protein)
MSDIKCKEQRSYNMSRIRSKNTAPDFVVRKYLFSKGYRYRLYSNGIIGKPDIVLRKYNTVIFINGCFWHQHERCKNANLPKSNTAFWSMKFQTNTSRDKRNKEQLQSEGWNVIVIWECQLTKKNKYNTLDRLNQVLQAKREKLKG